MSSQKLVSEHEVDQERFIATFLAENVRVSADTDIQSTAVEIAPFRILLRWKLKLKYTDQQLTGRYTGGSSTVFVSSAEELNAAVNAYGAATLSAPGAYQSSHRVLSNLADYGLRTFSELKVRDEGTEFARQYQCQDCGGSGRLTCHACGGSGRCRCGSCGGSGRNSCSSCSGSGRIAYAETYYVGSESHTRTAYRSCGCTGGTVTCHSCNGNGKVRCSGCGGSGQVTCVRCAGTGWRSTLRRLTLEVQADRAYEHGNGTSEVARETLNRYDPGRLPPATFVGTWTTAPAFNIEQHRVAYVMDAQTRFLSSRVAIADKTFDLLTYGTSLHIAKGGGIVEFLLREDQQELIAAINAPASRWLTAPFAAAGVLARATDKVLASRIHVHLLDRAYGATHGEELAGGVSKDYAAEVLAALKRALRMRNWLLSRSVWIAAFLLAVSLLIGAIRRWDLSTLHHHFNLGLMHISYSAGFAIAAAVALAFLSTHAIPALVLRANEAETALRCLLLVRGKSSAVMTFVATLALGVLALSATVLYCG